MRIEQELSYRKRIARQLRTQYAEGIYRHKYYTVTLKSRLRITQVHWKRNHWIDHTWLSSSRVIWRHRDLEVRGHSRSLKVAPFARLGTVSYSPSIVIITVSLAISEIIIIIRRLIRRRNISTKSQHQAMAWPWNLGMESFKVIENVAVRQSMYDFLLVRHCNYSSILYRLRVIWRWISSWPWSVG